MSPERLARVERVAHCLADEDQEREHDRDDAEARNAEAREAGRLLLEDEAKFIDLPRSPLWLSREEVIYAGSGS